MIDSNLPKANVHVHAKAMMTDAGVLHLATKYGVNLKKFKYINANGRRNWAGDNPSVSHEAYEETASLIEAPEDLYDVVYNGLISDSKKAVYTYDCSRRV